MDNNTKLNNSLVLLAKSSIIVFIGLFLSKVIAFFYRIIVARSFGIELYGVFTLATAIIGAAMLVSSFGIQDGVLRFISLFNAKKEKEKQQYIIHLSLKISIVSGIIAAIVIYFLSDIISINIFHNGQLSSFLKVFSFLIPIILLSNVFLPTLRALERIDWYSFIFNIVQNVVKIVLLLSFIWLGLKASALQVSYFVGTSAVLIFGFIVLRRLFPELLRKPSLGLIEKKRLKSEFLNYSFPLVFFSIFNMLFYWIDSFSLGYLKDASIVGLYNVAVPLALLLLATSELFMQLFFPLITKEYANKNLELIRELSKQVGKWILLVNIPAFIFIMFFAEKIIFVIFGADFVVSANALRILSAGMLVFSISSVSMQIVSMLGKSKLVLFNVVVASVLNFILNWIFIPLKMIGPLENDLGLVGAAVATFISMTIFCIMFIIQARRYSFVFPFRRKLLRGVVAALISSGFIYFIKDYLNGLNSYYFIFLMGIIYFGLYIGLLFALNSFDENDKKVIELARKKAFRMVGA